MLWNPLFSPATAWPWRDLARTDLASGPARFPAVRAHWNDEAVAIEALLPGVRRDALELSIDDDQLVLSGELQDPAERALRRERSSGRFQRRLALPFPVDASQAQAELADGLLRLRLPRRADSGPRRIEIRTKGDDTHAS